MDATATNMWMAANNPPVIRHVPRVQDGWYWLGPRRARINKPGWSCPKRKTFAAGAHWLLLLVIITITYRAHEHCVERCRETRNGQEGIDTLGSCYASRYGAYFPVIGRGTPLPRDTPKPPLPDNSPSLFQDRTDSYAYDCVHGNILRRDSGYLLRCWTTLVL